jgi:putative ABC transport system permease protein
MNTLRQILVVFLVGMRSLPQRRWTGVVIVLGVASVVGALLSMLSVTAGMARAYAGTASPTRAVVYLRGNDCACVSGIEPSWIGVIADAPGVAKRADGTPLVDAGFLMGIPPVEGFRRGTIAMFAIRSTGLALHPALTVVSGRMFRSGSEEVIVGLSAARRFGLEIGKTVSMPDGNWPVVGVFSDGGSLLESNVVADADTLLASSRRGGFGQVLVQLVSPAAFPAFRAWLRSNPAIAVETEVQTDYELRALDRNTWLFTRMAYLISAVMALGAVFGVVRILYATVRARTREIGILRALGYGAAPVATSILLETAVLSLAGALLGAALALAVFEGREMYVWGVIELHVPLRLIALGLAWAVAIAVLSGLFPALRAGRLPPVDALRET